MFGDPLQKNQEKVKLSEIAKIIMGQSPKGESYNTQGQGVPLLNGPAEFGENCPVEKQWTNKPTRICESGDILFCVRGATAGRLNWANKEYCIGRGLAAIRPSGSNKNYSEFIYLTLEQLYQYFQDKGVGSTFININRKEIEDLLIPKIDRVKADKFYQYAIELRKIKQAITTGNIIEDYPDDKYGASCLILGFTDNNRPLHIQSSYPLRPLIKIITIYQPSEILWMNNYTIRRK